MTKNSFDLKKYLAAKTHVVNAALDKYLEVKYPPLIYRAMRCSMFAGGKRLRPILVLEGARLCGGREQSVMPTACALEFIHTYSLIHDDLPAMDNDDYRRGKLTSHKKFGEDVAILAGDALLTEALGLVAKNAQEKGIGAERVINVLALLVRASGVEGMIGGQLVDTCEDSLVKKGKQATKKRTLAYIHTHKTLALIQASLSAGAMLAGASPAKIKALDRYGADIGLAFQIADDILDVVGDKKKLGKKGSDAQNKKLTYVSLYGLDGARRQAKGLVAAAKRELAVFGREKYILESLADFIIEREY